MTPRDLLERLAAEGVGVSLKVRLDGDTQPSPETLDLLTRHRDDLITYLAMAGGDTPQMCRLSEQLRPGAVWCRRCYRYQMHPCVASDKSYEDKN